MFRAAWYLSVPCVGTFGIARYSSVRTVSIADRYAEDGVPGIRRTVLSPSGAELFVFRLRCGKKLLMDDFVLVELGLGGKPALTEPGLDKKRHQVTRRRKNPRSGDLPQRSGGQRRRLPRSGVGRSQSRSDSGHLESNGSRLNQCR
ncbi:hypothetical protein BHM03_00036613 [Ensete ventricosum]|nr:hypothetical protein BHM03_00036613 [Ensete ventricosum]